MSDNARFDAVLDRIDRFNIRNGSSLSAAIDGIVSLAEDLRAENAHQSAIIEAQREVLEVLDKKLDICWSDGWLGLKKAAKAHEQEQAARHRLEELQKAKDCPLHGRREEVEGG